MLNTFVHVVMYSYYLLAALGPKVQPFLWWKKYLTALQMVQFILVIIHAFQLLFIECEYPKAFVWWIGMHGVMFYFLFREFYIEAYRRKELTAARKKELESSSLKEHQNESKQSDVTKNGVIYADQCKMATAYISDSGLRNRVFINNKDYQE